MLQWNCDAKSTFKINIGSLMLERTKLKLYFKNLLSSPALAVQSWAQNTRREQVAKGVCYSHLSAYRRGPKPVDNDADRQSRFSNTDPCEGRLYRCARIEKLEDLLPEGLVEVAEAKTSG